MFPTSIPVPDKPVCFECINDAQVLQADIAWWQLYYDTFANEEKEPPHVILNSLEQGVGLAFRVCNSEKTIGLATVHLLKNPAAVFLVYLAIAPEYRNKQIGSYFFDYIYQTGNDQLKEEGYRSVGFVWEVMAPQSQDAAVAEALKRKINFSQQNGGAVLPYHYLQPPVNGSGSVPMHIMFRPGDEGVSLEAINPTALIRAMYFEKYAAVNQIDPQYLEELWQDSMS